MNQLHYQGGDVVDLPEISQLLIIGASDSSFTFSESLQNLGLFEQVYHVESVTQGVRLIKEMKFAVVVIDHDDPDIDTISSTRIININEPLTRIILISIKLQINEIIELKNKGIIHGFIPLSERDVIIHSIIIKEQSAYQIDRSLMNLVNSPPKFTSLHEKLMEKPVAAKHYSFKFLGMAVLEETVFQYSFFMEAEEKLNPMLSSSYLSAMSIYGKELFEDDTKYPLSYIEFGQITIFIKTIDRYQYLFFIQKRPETRVKSIEKAIDKILNRFQIKFQKFFAGQISLDNDQEFQEELAKIMRLNNEQNLILDYEQKIIIANFDIPDLKLIEIFDSTDRVYDVHDFVDERHLYDFLKEEICHVLLINNASSNFEVYKSVTQTAKKFSPYTQIIVVLDNINFDNAFNLLNQDSIDKIISVDFTVDEYYEIIKRSVEKSKNIRKLSNLQDLYQFYLSSDRAEVVKTLLLQDPRTLDNITVPHFHGLIILNNNERIYSNFWIKDDVIRFEKEEILISFMISLMDFSAEYTDQTQSISSVKFGNSNIVVQKQFDLSFIYFIGDLDQSNIDYVQNYLSKYTAELFDIFINSTTLFFNNLGLSSQSTNGFERIVSDKCMSLVAELSIM